MRTTITTMLAVALVCATSVHGQVDNCVELLRLSRTTSRTVVDRSQFARIVNNVCNEIRSARSEKRSLNLDLRIMGLGEGGGSNATTDSLYTKYCSDQSAERRDEFNYQQYLEGIEPGAYAAYQACTTAASNDVEFQMLTSPTRDVLELVVFHGTNDPNGRANMSWSASDPVACQWESFRGNGEVEAPQRRILAANERTRLKCRRDSFNTEPVREPDFVNVIRDGGNATINIPWRKYGQDNNPVLTLEETHTELRAELSGELGRIERRLDAVEAAQELSAGYSVRFFNVDNVMSLVVNGRTVLECRIRQPNSCYVTREEFGEHLREGENDVAVELRNAGGATAYGYEIRRNGALLYAKSCGHVGDPVRGCGESSINGTPGTERLLDFVISVRR